MPDKIVSRILTYIHQLKDLGTIETQNYDLEVIDRMEKCLVTNKDGLTISTKE